MDCKILKKVEFICFLISNMPKVSIIVPCWGVEKYLNRCVESLVNQTLKDIEIILVDDESPDKVPVMCDDWAKKDSRIRVIHKKNGGLGFARNSGLDIATGEYVTFCDSDDYIELGAYEIMYNEAKKTNLDICYFKNRRFTDDGKKIEVCFDKNTYTFCGKAEVEQFLLNLVGRDFSKPSQSSFSMSVCMALFRLDKIKTSEVRFVSERTIASEDLIFMIEFIPHVQKIGVFPYVFYNYYINPSSITTTFNEGKYLRMMKLLKVVREKLLRNYKWGTFKNHYYSQQLRIIKITLRNLSNSRVSLKEKKHKIKKLCEDPIFTDVYKDEATSLFPVLDRGILFCMKHKLTLPIILMYLNR